MVQDTIVLAAVRQHEIDGICDYTRQLLASLAERDDIRVAVWNPRREPIRRFTELLAADDDSTMMVLLQYNPFSFGRWGFAPWLPAKLWFLRRSNPRVKIGLMAHEMYVPIKDWRSALMGAWQRFQLLAVRTVSDVVFASITAWAHELDRGRPRRPVWHLPVGSNLPDMRHTRLTERQRLGVDDKTVVLAAFGSDHPSRLMDYVTSASASVASCGIPTMLLNLGSNALPLDGGRDVDVLTPGRLESEEIARYLAAADLYLAPFIDGVSTRRGSVMAALQHGLSIVGTDGSLTDQVLRDSSSALSLTPVGDRDSFAAAARYLAANDAVRTQRGVQARALYDREFDWPVIASRLVTTLSTRNRDGSAFAVADG